MLPSSRFPTVTVEPSRPLSRAFASSLEPVAEMVAPSGVPVACVAIGGAKNAAIYATQILGATMPEYREKIVELKRQMAEA